MIFGFDTETYPIRPGRQAPWVVCVQTRAGGVEAREEGLDRLESELAGESILVAHNAAYDVACSIASRPRLLRPWFEAYSADRVVCTLVREKLIRVAQGTSYRFASHNLLECLERYQIPHDFEAGDKDGPDAWRTRYAELDGVPVSEWPEDALRYALADLAVEDIYQAQAEKWPAEWLLDQYRQSRADLLLYLQVCSGMRTDPRAIEAFARKVEIEHEAHRAKLTAAGIVRSDGSRIMAKARRRMRDVCEAKGLPVPITKTGRERESDAFEFTALDADACEASGDDLLKSYARYTSVGTLRRRAERLAIAGSIPIQPRFDVLKNSGRTSSSKGDVKPGKPLLAFGDQVQNLNREPGLRECYVARPGHVLISVDWSAAELHSLAQCCVWLGLESGLADVLNAGKDPHLNFGAHMNTWDYSWAKEALKGRHGEAARQAAKAARQAAKAANFGFPGGLGVATFRMYAAQTYGVELTESEAYELREWWFRLYPEMRYYFAHINELLEIGDPLVHFKSDRRRGDLRYTSAANSYFQGHTADMAKWSGWRLTRQYFGVDPGPLNLASPWNMIHDEYMAEAPEPIAHECAMEMVRIMDEGGRVWCPDVPCHSEPAISRRWRKGAEPEYRDGRLIPWEDRPMAPETRAKIREELDTGRELIYISWDHGFEEDRILQEVAA